MPMKKSSTRVRRRRAPARKSKRTYRRKAPKMTYDNLAKCSDMFQFGLTKDSSVALQTDTAENYQVDLSKFPRASAIAQQYQEFKIDYLEVRIKPYFDTYNSVPGMTPPTGSLTRAPQLYKYVVKTGETAPADANWFRANGVNAITLAKDKNITMRYKPAIRVGDTTTSTGAGTGFNTIKVSPWLSTNDTTAVGFVPNTTVHYGHCVFIDSQQASTTNTEVCQMEIEAHFVFRKPNTQLTSPSDPALVRINGEIVA